MTEQRTSKDKTENQRIKELRNEDPITGEPGAHPVATGIGAALTGVAAGAVAGSVAGPVGTIIGTVVGAVAGGLAGKAVGESNDPTDDIDYWRGEYAQRSYYDNQYEFEDYEPAFRAGMDVSNRGNSNVEPAISGSSISGSTDTTVSDTWEESEADARAAWKLASPNSQMDWAHARLAAKDAYDRRRQSGAQKPR